MAVLYNFKVSGRTSASTDGTATGLISTNAVTIDSDGFLRFTDSTGRPRSFSIGSDGGDISAFVKLLFTGVGGVDAGSAGVQGHRIFSEPAVLQ